MINEQEYQLNGCIIDKQHLLSFLSIIKEIGFESTDFSIEFEDGAKISDLTSESFSSYDFSNREIARLSIHALSYNFQTKEETKIYLSGSGMLIPISLTISSSKFETFSLMKTQIDNWIISVRNEKRKRLKKLLSHDIFLPAVVSLLLSAFTIIGTFLLFKDLNVLYGFMIGTISEVFWINICLKLLYKIDESFPETEIAIGLNKYQDKRKLYYSLLTIFILPFLYMILGFILPKIFNF